MSAVSNNPAITPPPPTELIPGIPADLNSNILKFIDPSTALTLPQVNRTWNANAEVQVLLKKSLVLREFKGYGFEKRIPAVYVTALRNGGSPIRRLPSRDLRHQNSVTPLLETPHPILRGEFGSNPSSPFIQIRVQGRPDSQVSYQTHLSLPPTQVRDIGSYIIIYQRYVNHNDINSATYAIAGSVLEGAVKDRHCIQANHSHLFCPCEDPSPIRSASIDPAWLQSLLSGQDPDFHVV